MSTDWNARGGGRGGAPRGGGGYSSRGGANMPPRVGRGGSAHKHRGTIPHLPRGALVQFTTELNDTYLGTFHSVDSAFHNLVLFSNVRSVHEAPIQGN
jgi:hypothetical protein